MKPERVNFQNLIVPAWCLKRFNKWFFQTRQTQRNAVIRLQARRLLALELEGNRAGKSTEWEST